ncbi:hypothetical protein RyT2_27260 [Pseudolactococcus yaeyamensis]
MINKIKNIEVPRDLAVELDLEYKQLTYFLNKQDSRKYVKFHILKKSGGFREINSPIKELKGIQKRIALFLIDCQSEILLERFQQKYPEVSLEEEKGREKFASFKENQVSHGFEKNKSILTNAEKHKSKRYVINIDLHDFFNSFHFGRVSGFFIKNKNFQLPEKVAYMISNLCCYEGKLPQGAPTSPVITNLICNFMDLKILNLVKKYKLFYTRYADDLTFSTNQKTFLDNYEHFFRELEYIIQKNGFKINHSKTRLLYKSQRQEVTGLLVNEKVNIKREYYRSTRSMAYRLYNNKDFYITDKRKSASIEQLSGRFDFIYQVYKHNKSSNTGFLKEYERFLIYKYFYANKKPVIVCEGKTDPIYLKAAIKNLHTEFPKLIEKNEKGFNFKIHFLRRSELLSNILDFAKEGSAPINNLYKKIRNNNGYNEYFKNYRKPTFPVILLLDNELVKGKPLQKFVNDNKNLSNNLLEHIKEKNYQQLKENFFLLTNNHPSDFFTESEIENLFINTKVNFDGSIDYNGKIFYSKDKFSKYIALNYKDVDFSGFKILLENFNNILNEYSEKDNEIEKF